MGDMEIEFADDKQDIRFNVHMIITRSAYALVDVAILV